MPSKNLKMEIQGDQKESYTENSIIKMCLSSHYAIYEYCGLLSY